MFNIKRASILLVYNRYAYIIELKGGDSLYRPLYNLLTKELGVLQDYLNNTLAKG
jgi:hypothetical protein